MRQETMFKLTIATGNDAFAHPGGAYELERILREVGETVRFCVTDASAETASARLRDANGATVGEWSLNAPEGEEEGAHSPPEDSGTARPPADPIKWTQTKGGAWVSGEYAVVERIDDKGWNAHLGGIALLVGAPLAECKAACERFAAEDFPLAALIAAKEALFSGGAPDPELADGRAVLKALEAAGLLTPRARTELATADTGCVSLLADLDAGKPVHAEAAATIRGMVRELAEHENRNADKCADEAG
jgi:hypothetical protein